ncbi:MAG TPA: prepilin-type N-terminal cleavage/methylation domain-containing protein [Gemmatimonadota bacterium]|nr:prepilin-type N-terminal cleavage/methylation domain-containing protein [Gemmatimonadota bacterium]
MEGPIRGSSGFTLIEMMVVLVVIGILAAIAIVSFGSSTQKAQITAMKSDLRNLVSAEQGYYADQVSQGQPGSFTNQVSDLDFKSSPGVTIKIRKNASGWSARATHANVKKVTCSVFQGSISPYPPATAEGEIACE